MKYILFLSILYTAVGISQTDTKNKFPELRFAHLKDLSLASLSFTKKCPDHVKLTNEYGDSSLTYNILSGTLECFDTGEKETIKMGGYLSDEAKFMLAKATPGLYKFTVYCKSVDLSTSFETSLHFALGLYPVTQLADIRNADSTVTQTTVDTLTRIKMGYPIYPHMDSFFQITGGTVEFAGGSEVGQILPGGIFDTRSLTLLKDCAGKNVILTLEWKDATGVGRKNTFWFKVLPKN